MNALWSFVWPLLVAGLVVGLIAGLIGFRRPSAKLELDAEGEQVITPEFRRKRRFALVGGVLASITAALLWTGPVGAGNLFAHRVERDARITLDHYEMYHVTAHLHRGPLSRRLILSGPADDFQHSELMRIMETIPGVREARWTEGSGLPLIVESMFVAILGFLLGLLLAYLVELHRRYNAQWNW